ncbi:MAG: hypothetical protein ACM3ZD_06125, partial [Betaproteobacteria bacterium]
PLICAVGVGDVGGTTRGREPEEPPPPQALSNTTDSASARPAFRGRKPASIVFIPLAPNL